MPGRDGSTGEKKKKKRERKAKITKSVVLQTLPLAPPDSSSGSAGGPGAGARHEEGSLLPPTRSPKGRGARRECTIVKAPCGVAGWAARAEPRRHAGRGEGMSLSSTHDIELRRHCVRRTHTAQARSSLEGRHPAGHRCPAG